MLVPLLLLLLFLCCVKGIHSCHPDFSRDCSSLLKGFLVLLVIWHHMPLAECHTHTFGKYAVALFFFMSGYGLMHGRMRQGASYLSGFFFRRLTKLLLPYIVAWLVYAAIEHESLSWQLFANHWKTGETLVPYGYFVEELCLFYLVFYCSVREKGGGAQRCNSLHFNYLYDGDMDCHGMEYALVDFLISLSGGNGRMPCRTADCLSLSNLADGSFCRCASCCLRYSGGESGGRFFHSGLRRVFYHPGLLPRGVHRIAVHTCSSLRSFANHRWHIVRNVHIPRFGFVHCREGRIVSLRMGAGGCSGGMPDRWVWPPSFRSAPFDHAEAPTLSLHPETRTLGKDAVIQNFTGFGSGDRVNHRDAVLALEEAPRIFQILSRCRPLVFVGNGDEQFVVAASADRLNALLAEPLLQFIQTKAITRNFDKAL